MPASAAPLSINRSVKSALGMLSAADLEMATKVGEYFADPYGFVLFAFPWGQKGTRLEKESGPDDWQIEVLIEIGELVAAGVGIDDAMPILEAVASGHGIGKTALIAWIILWFIATRQHPQIIVTAGKKDQLTGKTWRELAKWHKMCLCGHWFHWTATKLEHVLFPETWFAHAIPWSKSAPENFAGTHEEHVLVIFDEASAIHDVIWETTDGAMTTPGAMWIAFGNPTRSSGRFAKCFGKLKSLWKTRHIDSRSAKKANRKILDAWIKEYGEDSDFCRVRIRGLFPRSGTLQFITLEEVSAANKREAVGFTHFGKVMGVDVARHGDDQTVICRRQGAKVWPLKRMRVPNLMTIAAMVAEVIDNWKPDMVFVDATGMGWGIVDRLHQLGYTNVVAVQTGENADQPERFKNKGVELWYRMREAIREHLQLPIDPELEQEMTEREYGFDDKQRYMLETKDDMKSRDLPSPDGADSLALTYTSPVAPTKQKRDTWRDKLKKQARGARSPMAA